MISCRAVIAVSIALVPIRATSYFEGGAALGFASCTSNCQAAGGLIVCPSSDAENSAADSMCPSLWCWLGYTDSATEGTWVCERDGAVSTYFNWDSGQPDVSGAEDCAGFGAWTTTKWHDVGCWDTAGCVCEACEAGKYSSGGSCISTPEPSLRPTTIDPSLAPTPSPTMERITAITHEAVVTPRVRTDTLHAKKVVINGEPFDPSLRRRLLQLEGGSSWSYELQLAENERLRNTLAQLERRLDAYTGELADQRATIDRQSATIDKLFILLEESRESVAVRVPK